MSYPLPLTRTEAYLAYKAGVIQQSELKPSLAVPRIGIDAWLAYWTQLANDYPKNPDGTPMILQEEEAYIAYLCGVIDTYPEECLRRVGAYLRYIISARWGRPDHPLNREELYLSLIKTQFIPSGDPSSDIVIDGTTKAPFVDVKVYGDTFQQTYTGQNLYNVAWVSTGTYVTKDDDGWITITRDNTSGDSTVYTNVWTSNLALETSTQYKIFIEVKAVSGTGSLFVTSTTSTQGQFNSWQEKKLANMVAGQTYTVAPTTKSSFSGISQGLRTVLEQTAGQGGSVTFRLSVCASSTPTDTFSYEPYTGGQPSPSPEYPQPIQTVTGLQAVEVHGKNLIYLEPNTGSPYLNGLSSSYDNQSGAIHIHGTPTDSWSNIGARTNLSLPAGTYTISATNNQQTHSKSVYAYHPDGTRTQFYIGPTEQFKTVTVSKPIVNYYIYVSQMTIGEAIDDIFYMQLEKGSTATDYEPYSSTDYGVDLNCNIYDKSQSYRDGYDIRIPIAINPGSKYAFSAPTGWVGAYLYDSAGTLTRTIGHTSSTRSGEFTAEANEVKAVFTFYAWEDVTWSWTDIKFYDVAGVIKLCGLDNYQDYIYEDGNDWKVHKEIGEVTLDGSETWTKDSANSGYRFWTSKATDIKTSIDAVLKANRLGVAQGDTWEYDGISGSSSTNPIRLFIRDALFNDMTAEQLRAWLTTHNIIAYYALATPTDTVITNQNLIAQLNALKQGGAEEGTTYIKVSATDPNLPAKLYVEAPKYD